MPKTTSLANKIGVLCLTLLMFLVTLRSAASAQELINQRSRLNSLETQNFQLRQQLNRLETLRSRPDVVTPQAPKVNQSGRC